MGRAVWVTRPAPGNARTSTALKQAGYEVVAAPVLELRCSPPARLPVRLPDWLVFVSRTAVLGLAHALNQAQRAALAARAPKVAAVGQQTAEAAQQAGFPVTLVPKLHHSEGLLNALSSYALGGCTVWIPSGDRQGSATHQLPEGLATLGALPEVFQVYQVVSRQFDARALVPLGSATPGAMIIHSPSAADAIYAAKAPRAFTRWREGAVAVAIGPVTAARLRDLGAWTCHVCHEPSDRAVLATLERALSVSP